jgi:hypothetical protein
MTGRDWPVKSATRRKVDPSPRASDNAEDFKQGAMFEKAADTHAADGTLLKIPLC